MRSGRWTRPRPRRTQSPQLRRPSEAVHGRSKAKRKTLTVATRMAAPHTGQGRPKTAAYCAESAGPISAGSTRALHDEALHPLGLGPFDDRVSVAPREGIEIGVGAGIGREHFQPPARRERPRSPSPASCSATGTRARGSPRPRRRSHWRGGNDRVDRGRVLARHAVAGLDPGRHAAGDVHERPEAVALERFRSRRSSAGRRRTRRRPSSARRHLGAPAPPPRTSAGEMAPAM